LQNGKNAILYKTRKNQLGRTYMKDSGITPPTKKKIDAHTDFCINPTNKKAKKKRKKRP